MIKGLKYTPGEEEEEDEEGEEEEENRKIKESLKDFNIPHVLSEN